MAWRRRYVCLVWGTVIAIGIALLVGAFWRTIAGVRIGRPELTVSREVLRPGETFFARYHQSFRTPIDILESKVELLFRETAIYRRRHRHLYRSA